MRTQVQNEREDAFGKAYLSSRAQQPSDTTFLITDSLAGLPSTNPGAELVGLGTDPAFRPLGKDLSGVCRRQSPK